MLKAVFAEPFIADANALATVMLEQIIILVITSVLHVGISSIQRSSNRAVSGACFYNSFILITPAAFCIPAPKIITTNGNDIAAIAQAFPCNLAVVIPSVFSNNGEPAKTLSRYINFVYADTRSLSHVLRASHPSHFHQ